MHLLASPGPGRYNSYMVTSVFRGSAPALSRGIAIQSSFLMLKRCTDTRETRTAACVSYV